MESDKIAGGVLSREDKVNHCLYIRVDLIIPHCIVCLKFSRLKKRLNLLSYMKSNICFIISHIKRKICTTVLQSLGDTA